MDEDELEEVEDLEEVPETEGIDPEEVEEIRDSMAQEALIAFFLINALMGEDDSESSLMPRVERWAVGGARRLLSLYVNGFGLRQALKSRSQRSLSDNEFSNTQASEMDEKLRRFSPSRQTLRKLFRSIKGMRSRLRELKRSRDEGKPQRSSLTPESASLGVANEAVAYISDDAAVEISDGFQLPPGTTIYKTWITRRDGRVRPLHMRLDGVVKAIGEDFWRWPATGQVLGFPGDPRAPIEVIANCRCFLVLHMG